MAHIPSIGAGVFSDFTVASPAVDLTNAELAALTTSVAWQKLFASEITTGIVGVANGGYVRVENVREFPSIGAPSNIVNVAQFGSKASKQINGQADAPTVEITINFIATEWDTLTSRIALFLNDGKYHAFRFALLNSQPFDYGVGSVATVPAGKIPTTAGTYAAGAPIPFTSGDTALFNVGQRMATAASATAATKIGRITAVTTLSVTLDTAYTVPPTPVALVTLSGIAEVSNSQWFFYGKIEALLINPQLTDANTATLTISVASDFFGPYTADVV